MRLSGRPRFKQPLPHVATLQAWPYFWKWGVTDSFNQQRPCQAAVVKTDNSIFLKNTVFSSWHESRAKNTQQVSAFGDSETSAATSPH